MGLTKTLEDFKEQFLSNAPKEVQKEMAKAHQELVEQKLAEEAVKVGETFPDFELKNAQGELKKASALMGDKPFMVVAFYRGGWCPYCNLELKALEENLSTFNELGANMVAISPELPDSSIETVQKNGVHFEVLSDEGAALSKKLNLAFDLPENLKPIYKDFGIDVHKHNGNYTLPLPATYILDRDLKVVFQFADADYTKRLDPQDIVDFLRNQKH